MTAYATNRTHSAGASLSDRLNAFFVDMRARMARRRVYRQTFTELAVLSDRELADLGLGRTEIRRVAYQAAYEM